MFAARSLEKTCLQTAPIFALNLLPLNNVPANEGGDAVQYRSFSLEAAGENGINTTKKTEKIKIPGAFPFKT